MIAEVVVSLEFHSVVFIWPAMQPDEFAKLVEDILANGLREPIWTYQGKIIDGRHRYLACQEARREPRYQEWDGQGSLILFVASLNQHRRHLDAGQRAMIAVEIEEQLAQEARERQREAGRSYGEGHPKSEEVLEIFPKPPLHAAEEAGKIVGINPRYVTDAKKVSKQAPELKPLVKERIISLPDAKRLAIKPEDERKVIVERVVSGEQKNVKTAELAIKKEHIEAQVQSAPLKPCITLASCFDWLPQQGPCDLLLTDPPYSTDVQDIAIFAGSWLPLALQKVKENGRAYICIGAYPEELRAYLNVPCPAHLSLSQVLVWTYKNTLGPEPHHTYKQNWQAILYYVGIHALALNHDAMTMNEQLSVQEINAPDGRCGDRYHAWQKPDTLAERLIRHATRPGDTIMDCFVGTGTFVLAAHRLGRIACGCEKSQEMAEIARKRGCEVENA